MGDTKKYDQPHGANEILILADFSDGLWDAVTFSVKVLFREGITIKLLETYQKPRTGQSLMLDLDPILENNALQELMALKKKMVSSFKLSTNEIKLILFKGNLIPKLRHEASQNNILCVVVNSHGLFAGSYTFQIFKIWRIVRKVSLPVFIWPVKFSETVIFNILYSFNPSKESNEKVFSELGKLFRAVNYRIHILFAKRKDKVENEQAENMYRNHPLYSKFIFHYVDNSILIQEIQAKMELLDGNLLVIDRSYGSGYQKYIRSCIFGGSDIRKIPVLFI